MVGLLGCSKNNLFFTGQQSGHFNKLGVYKETHIWQTESKKFDILFIINNSPAMEVEQWQLGEQIDHLLRPIAYMDWRAGIVEADYRASNPSNDLGRLVQIGDKRIITPHDPRSVFIDNIVRPLSKGGCSQCPRSYASPLFTLMHSIEKRHTDNKDFFRPEAQLVVFVLTNENEKKKHGAQAITHRDVLEVVNQAFGNGRQMTVYGLAVLPRDKACYDRQKKLKSRGSYALELMHLARATRGHLYSVCDNQYTKSLKSIGAQIQQHATQYIELDHIPQENTLNVRTEAGRPLKWSLNGRKLYITERLDKTQMLISYKPQE